MNERQTLPLMKRMNQTLTKLYQQLNRWTRGGIEIMVMCMQTFNDNRVTQAAASLGYYTIFSIFPLMIALIVVGSWFVDPAQVRAAVEGWILEFVPFAVDFVQENLDIVFERSNVVGLVAIGSLLWSATTVFYILVYHINLPWSRDAARQPLKNRIVALAIIGILLLALVSSTLVNTVVGIINQLLPFLNLLQSPLWNWLLLLLPIVLRFMVYFGLYKWVPNVSVRRLPAVISALLAMIALEATSQGFRYLVQTGLVEYQFIYGTLGSIMTLMLYVYFNFVVMLFCAHLSHAINVYIDRQSRGRRNMPLERHHYLLKSARNNEKDE
jgi:membrane protein